MEKAGNQGNRAAGLPAGAGVIIAAGFGALFWIGAFALLW